MIPCCFVRFVNSASDSVIGLCWDLCNSNTHNIKDFEWLSSRLVLIRMLLLKNKDYQRTKTWVDNIEIYLREIGWDGLDRSGSR
jgi:hypothetical protein